MRRSRVPASVVWLQTAVGYTQGKSENPTYREVCSGSSGHVEAVLVEYDPSQVSYDTLLDVFWHKHDPTQKDGQVSGGRCCRAFTFVQCRAAGKPAIFKGQNLERKKYFLPGQ